MVVFFFSRSHIYLLAQFFFPSTPQFWVLHSNTEAQTCLKSPLRSFCCPQRLVGFFRPSSVLCMLSQMQNMDLAIAAAEPSPSTYWQEHLVRVLNASWFVLLLQLYFQCGEDVSLVLWTLTRGSAQPPTLVSGLHNCKAVEVLWS